MKMLKLDIKLWRKITYIYIYCKVSDFFHYTGKYKDDAHSVCNLNILMMGLFMGALGSGKAWWGKKAPLH